MAFVLKQALEFNKFTIGLAAAGLAYAATIGSETSPSNTVPVAIKILSTATILAFAISILFGVFVMGRAAKINKKDDEYVDDDMMKCYGKGHSFTLLLGLFLAGLLMLNKIWKFV